MTKQPVTVCPVCSVANENSVMHCTTCNWYFPLEKDPQYDLELSRAKQNWQMVSSFNQVFQHMQVQSKILEKMSFRLDGLESEVEQAKKNGYYSDVNAGDEPFDEAYPVLKPLEKAEYFNTPEKRIKWWSDLEGQWKKALNQSFLNAGEIEDTPTDDGLVAILTAQVIRIVGPRGMNPSISFEITNLSGLKHLTNLTHVFCTHGSLENLEGIEHLEQLESIFCNSNKLNDIRAVHYLPKLANFYCNANQITNLLPAKDLAKLEVLYCCYNQLTSLKGIHEGHLATIKQLCCLPNDKLSLQEIKRVEDIGIPCLKG